ncbi:MAG: alpha/beta hydrolase [Clostridia bacterium]|nr:alpha/beta hydrolase [Clostridia bacterium]
MLFIYIAVPILLFLALVTLIIAYVIYKMAFHAIPDPNADNYIIADNKQCQDNRDFMLSIVKELDELPFEEVTVTSHDGLKLFGRYYHVADGAPVHIEFHGYRSMAIRDFSGGDRIVRSLKHNTLLVDQRAHGRSEGNIITFGIKERMDCLTWIDYVSERFGRDTKIFLIGVSMGAATVLMATELSLPDNVVGVMADCPYDTPWHAISGTAKKMHIPPRLAFPFVCLSARLFGRFGLNQCAPVTAVTRANVPILLVHGEGDHLLPCDMSRAIAGACASEITFITVPEAGHGMSYVIQTEKYTEEAIKFINNCLKES